MVDGDALTSKAAHKLDIAQAEALYDAEAYYDAKWAVASGVAHRILMPQLPPRSKVYTISDT